MIYNLAMAEKGLFRDENLEKLRNINIAFALGSVAVGIVVPELAAVMEISAIWNGAQAVAIEGIRRIRKSPETAPA